MKWRDYLSLARTDHWFKNVFMLPGTIIAFLFTRKAILDLIGPLCIGVLAVCLISSANYVINEWLDASFDRFHPVKKNRAAVRSALHPSGVYFEYGLLLTAGALLSIQVSLSFFVAALSLAGMGVLYNVSPIRTKDRVYLDVLSESVNNPIRLILGWLVVTDGMLPPSSLLLGYWMAGAFLMGIKRFAEYRFIGNVEQAGFYRRSFRVYTEETLLISSFFYALCAAFFLGVFLVKYRIEFIVMLPFLAFLFTWYARIGFLKDSPAQYPERLLRQRKLIGYLLFLAALFVGLSWIDLPGLQGLFLNTLQK